MSDSELRLLCNYSVFVIILIVVAFALGILFEKYVETADIKDEYYYQDRSAEIYIIATDYISCRETAEKIKIKEILEEKIFEYNKETRDIKKWKFNCPKTFTLEYLIGGNDEI